MNHGHFINGAWVDGSGDRFESYDPSTGQSIATFSSATPEECAAAITAATAAFPRWSALAADVRKLALQRFAEALEDDAEELGEIISLEVGKPRWEAATEVRAMISKVAISIDAFEQRCAPFTAGAATTRFKPHGVLVVLGPFNFPGHLPNGHIVPALLAGNTVVFKPSELAPATAARTVEIWDRCGLPPGVLNLVQGDGLAGKSLTENPAINGVLFTGSAATGSKLQKFFAAQPGKILALEMGGNNPLVVERVENADAAILIAIESAFVTAGQRCTCARRLIVRQGSWGDDFIERLASAIDGIRVGRPNDQPPPFMGAVISPAAARGVLDAQRSLLARGAVALRQAQILHEGTGLTAPGLVDVTAVEDREDGEIFGPLLQVIRVADFDAAIAEANNTSFGLAAGLVSDEPGSWQLFRQSVRAGVVNWNRPTTGASGAAPFGGVGRSGNFRPSAWLAADYCSWPVASIEAEHPTLPNELPPGLQSPGPRR